MTISKIKAAWAFLTGGLTGGIKFFLDAFNDQILAKIPNKEEGSKYLKDVQDLSVFITAITKNHDSDLTDKRKECLKVILSAIDELAKALEDFNITTDELDAIIVKIQEAIDTFKSSK